MNTIKMTPVDSSQIARMGFEEDETASKGTMSVEFKNGDVWHYTSVPVALYDSIRGSDSVGKTFNTVKNRLAGKKVA